MYPRAPGNATDKSARSAVLVHQGRATAQLHCAPAFNSTIEESQALAVGDPIGRGVNCVPPRAGVWYRRLFLMRGCRSFSPQGGEGSIDLNSFPRPLGREAGERSEPGEGVSDLFKFVYISRLRLRGDR